VLTEAIDGDRSLSVVLDDLVIGGLSTSALDQCVTVALDGKSILAHVNPPHVLNGAFSFAVNTLNLVFANDDVLKSTAVLDIEDSVLVAALCLTSALNATAVGPHLAIEDTVDLVGLLVGYRGSLRLRDGEGGALAERNEVVGGGGSRAGSGEACDGSDDSKRELHCEGWMNWGLGNRKEIW
jgi:hypothetical protein